MSKKKRYKYSLAQAIRMGFRSLAMFFSMSKSVFFSKIAASLLAVCTPLVNLYFSALFINELAGRREEETLIALVLIILSVNLLLGLLGAVAKHWNDYSRSYFSFEYKSIAMKKYLNMDFLDIDRQSTHELQNQIDQASNFMGWGPFRALEIFEEQVSALFKILGGAALSFSLFVKSVPEGSALEWLNSPLAMTGILASMIFISVLSPRLVNRGEAYWLHYNDEGTFGNRYLGFFGYLSLDSSRAVDIRMYNQQEMSRHFIESENVFGVGSKIAKAARGPMGILFSLSHMLTAVLMGVVYFYVCLKAFGGAFGIGSVTQYIGATTSFFVGMTDFLATIGAVRGNAEFLSLFYRLWDMPNTMYKGSLTTEKRTDRNYEVEFRDVSFKYPETDIYALRHVNMKFRVGSRLAVVGMNGSGKTTFIKLLCRLYDPTEGEILLNGIDIRKYEYREYIDIFSVVFQDFKLFSLPLGQNIAAAESYSASRVDDAIRKVGFEGRAQELSGGLETYVNRDLDDDGVKFSGGESQKIAIARALYKDAPFIILDEPTAALDPIAEAEIYEKFSEIAGDRTAIYISHRLSSCKFCDEILVFHEGRVVQKGSHSKLLEDTNGKYHELWNAQAQYYV